MAVRGDDPVPPFAFSRERISFELVLDPASGAAELNDLRSSAKTSGTKGKADLIARWMVVPYRGDRSSNIKAWDNTGYVFGRSKKAGVEQKKRNRVRRT